MDAKGTVLVLEVNAGLCNRIRAFVSGLCWAEKLNRRLVVCWPDEKPECAATFSNLFQGVFPDWVEIRNEILVRPKRCLSPTDANTIFSQAVDGQPIFIKSHGCFWSCEGDGKTRWLEFLRSLQPSLVVKNLLTEWQGSRTTWTAVHIRRTDNDKAILSSPLSAFQTRLEKEKEFFLFSDDFVAVESIKVIYPHAQTVEWIRKRNTLEGMIEGTAVFFMLSGANRILGSASSSFSEIAALHGNTSLELVV
jgi:hypothetical protein